MAKLLSNQADRAIRLGGSTARMSRQQVAKAAIQTAESYANNRVAAVTATASNTISNLYQLYNPLQNELHP